MPHVTADSGTAVAAQTCPEPGLGLRGLALPAGVAAFAGGGSAYLYLVDPNQPTSRYPACVFHAVTGLWCPGCGSARALHALLHLDVATALARNPFVVAAVLYLGWVFVTWSRRRVTGVPRWMAPPWLLHGVLAAVVLFWVLRNVPGMTWLSPD
jgi:hypothetical protein